MQSLRHCFRKLSLSGIHLQGSAVTLAAKELPALTCYTNSVRHYTLPYEPDPSKPEVEMEEEEKGPKKWLTYNEKIFPVQAIGEERRPAYVCHMKTNIKYSLKKMWYVASFIRGMSIDEAIKQLSFLHKKGGAIVKETLLEAQQIAVEKHNVEFKSNLWVAESFTTKAFVIKGLRRHARKRAGEIRYIYIHYFVRLEEGKPPENYYLSQPKSLEQHIEDYKTKMRMRKVTNSL